MSKFWGDFGQAFSPAYGQSTQRTDRLAAVARAEAAQEAALKLAAEQRKDDLLWRKRQADIAQRRWELEQESKASALGLAAREKRGIIAGQLGEAGLPLGGGAPYVPTELESQMYSIAVANAKRKVKEEADKRMRSALDAAAAQGYTPPPEGVRAPGLTPQDVIARGSEAKLAADIDKEQRGEERGKREAMFPKWQPPVKPPKPSDKVRAHEKMELLRGEYNNPETPQGRREAIAAEALGLLPFLYGQATQTHTIEDAEGYLQGKGLPPNITGTARTKEPASPEALSKEETDHLNAARIMQRTKNLYMAKYSDKEAKKNITIQGQLSNWIKNVAGPAAGLDAWKDPKAARFFAEAENLTAKALQQTHQMMGGGAFSEPDRILYRRTIPHTDTYSPVQYMAKLEAWSDGLDDYVNYMTARQKIAGLPRLVSDMEPWQVMKFTGKKDDDGNEIISKGMAEMLIEHKLALNPETNKAWTGQGLLDYQRENAQHGFTKRDMLNFIVMLPYEVEPPR